MAAILSAALLLDISFGQKEAADAIIQAVDRVLKRGYRTGDIANAQTPKDKIAGTQAIGEMILHEMHFSHPLI
jgi:3-isopropylmalate dehydrogenase